MVFRPEAVKSIAAEPSTARSLMSASSPIIRCASSTRAWPLRVRAFALWLSHSISRRTLFWSEAWYSDWFLSSSSRFRRNPL